MTDESAPDLDREPDPASAPEVPGDSEAAADPEAAPEALPDPRASADADESIQLIDLIADEMTLARAQLDAGQSGLAEGTLLRRLAWLEADGAGLTDETDALRALLAEALWRQGRLAAARRAVDAIRPSSPQRRLPTMLVIEADVLAAAGERDRASGAMERVITAVGVDAAFEIRGGMPGPLSWPLPSELRPQPVRAPHPPWSPSPNRVDEEPAPPAPDDERIAAGRARMEEARVAYVAGDLERGDGEMSIAVRLEPALAGDGVAIIEPTLGARPSPERLLLYGDLLRAAGRRSEADDAYDRAAGRRA